MSQVTEAADRLRERVSGLSRGGSRVADAAVETRYDEEGAPYVLLVLLMAKPASDLDTWPVEDIFEIRQEVRRIAMDVAVTVPVTISLSSDEPEEGEEREAPASSTPGRGGSSS